ncbi:cyclase family protein [Ureibacillus massiliensis]|uniref:cyclase family protein n=1 Tax=Ureibacillus massiliensis TaxID=292806 RepID=UPI00068ABE61|nr:cyclase family protein [Ureibacillus massiliensis]
MNENVRYIDLTLDVVSQDSWIQFPRKILFGALEPPTKIEPLMTVEKNGAYVSAISTTTHSFTHIDSPAHFKTDGLTIDRVPLDQLIGDAVVIDMLHKQPGEGVSAEDLENANVEVKEGDIAIIRTGWTDKAWGTREFWEKMIYLEADAGQWLADRKVKALLSDFMTDLAPLKTCDCCQSILPSDEGSKYPSHHTLLGNGIILIEWCTNLGELKKERVKIIALPLKIKDGDASQARVIAIEEQ